MLSFNDTIRAKVTAQNIHQQVSAYNPQARLKILDQAWFITGDFGFQARSKSKYRSPSSRLLKDGALKMPLDKKNRIISLSTYLSLIQSMKKPVLDSELVSVIEDIGVIDRYELAEKIDISIKKVDYRVRKEINHWNLIKVNNQIWHWQAFSRKYDKIIVKRSKQERLQDIILKIMKIYPYLNVDQISLLSGIHKTELAKPFADLTRNQIITRGLPRENSPNEIYSLGSFSQPVVDWESIEPFVLEKGDALVETIKLERFFTFGPGNYWIFIEGIPQAAFNFAKKGRQSRYTLEGIQLHSTSVLEIPELLDHIKIWAESNALPVEINLLSNPLTKLASVTAKLLLERGYTIDNNDFILRTHSRVNQEKNILGNNLGKWHKTQQFVPHQSTLHLLEKFVQLDDIQSIAYRMNVSAQTVNLDNIVYISGIHYRLGYIPLNLVHLVVTGWPRYPRLKILDKEIIRTIEQPTTAEQLAIIIKKPISEIIQRVRYLENVRLIRRQIPGPMGLKSCKWILFREGMPDDLPSNPENRALASVAKLLEFILSNNIPLTLTQLSRYFGLSTEELELIKKNLIQNEKIVEGYFLDGVEQLQLTVPSILTELERKLTVDESNEEIVESSAQRIDLAPETDPLTIFHLNPLIMADRTLLPTNRRSIHSETWLILWDGIPVGYLVKTPSNFAMIDYELDIQIRKNMSTTPVISGTIQKMVALMRSWYQEEGKINSINNIPISDKKWERLHFLIQSLGIKL